MAAKTRARLYTYLFRRRFKGIYNDIRRPEMRLKITALISVIILMLVSCTGQTTTGPAVETDREGNAITIPGRIEKIISMGPSNTEVLTALGAADKIIAIDEYSAGISGVPSGIPMFDMLAPDGERIIALEPDAIFVTGMSKVEGADFFKPVTDVGVCVMYIPSSNSLDGIKEDIRFIAAVMGMVQAGDDLIDGMNSEINAIREAAAGITDRKTVYFEISAAPYMYSFGTGTFLNEMIEIIGGVNIFADQNSWISVSDEAVPQANPDVILTSVDYIDNPAGEIMSRPGWNEVTAIKNGDVYTVDANASNRPSHNVVIALRQMAVAVYPDIFQ